MSKARMSMKLMVVCLLLGACALPVLAVDDKPSVAQMLSFRPRQPGVPYYTPSPDEEKDLIVELDPGKGTKKGSGWVLRTKNGQLLRRFFDSKGDKKVDIWSYYNKQGVEVYRETATTLSGKPDQYRWMNAGGTKFGIDMNQDGKIDYWKMISPEEVSQEILQALITKDIARVRALMITEAEIKELGLPAAQVARIRELETKASAKFQDTIVQLPNLVEKTQWVHLETTPPQCEPAEQTGMPRDLIHYTRGTIMCQTNDKTAWVQTGEMIQVGLAWRIVDAPSIGSDDDIDHPPPPPPELKALMDKLADLDKLAPKAPEGVTPSPDMVRYQLQRADIIEQIAAKVKPEERTIWIRQLADCLSTAAQSSPDTDKTAYQRLLRLEDQFVKGLPPGHELAGFVVFRRISVEYADKLKNTPTPQKFTEVQQEWLDQLTKFVQTYPRADDTPDAMLQAGMVSEMLTKEAEAKKWYQLIVTNFPEKQQAVKAGGALRRLESEGKLFELSGPVLGTGCAVRYDQSAGQGSDRLLLGELEPGVRRRFCQVQVPAQYVWQQGAGAGVRQPRQHGGRGRQLPGQVAGSGHPSLPGQRSGQRPRQPAGDALRHHGLAEHVPGRQGRQGNQSFDPGQQPG